MKKRTAIHPLRCGALALAAVLAAAPAVEAQVPAPPQARPVALVGATIHTVSDGVIENGTIVFANGRITAVGTNVTIPPGAEQVDATGKHIYPGLVDAYSAMGLEEIGSVDVTSDANELGDFNPNVRAEVAVNPESRHIGTARSHGVLVAVTTPGGGRVSGMSAALSLDGWTWEEMTLQSGTAMNVNWPSTRNQEGYAEGIRELRDMFATARAYRDARAAGGHDTDLRWEAMVPVVDGDMPVVVSASGVREIQDAIAWSEDENIRLIIRGASDADYIADQLAEKQIPLLLTSTMGGPERMWEGYDANYSLAARLHEKGVRFAITGGSSAAYNHRLPYEAGVAVAFGLSEEEALKAVTLSPAQFLGIADRVGSLEVGKDATLLITNGNPLDYLASVEQAYIEGRAIDMNDIHKQLFEKYMEKLRQRAVIMD
ncbi:MAG: amidohydrolase family protein [Gemmatimonadota bacterium]